MQHLSESLEGDLDPQACTRLEAHVGQCGACRERCEGPRRVLAACARAPDEAPLGPGLERAIRSKIRAAVAARK
ncbi:MAG: hypothetical protein GY946_19080 [bacterium]|nr:hypothetical protein [bacterium]